MKEYDKDKNYDEPYSHPRWWMAPGVLTCFCNHCSLKEFYIKNDGCASFPFCKKYPKKIPAEAFDNSCNAFIPKEGTTKEMIDKINKDIEYGKYLKTLDPGSD